MADIFEPVWGTDGVVDTPTEAEIRAGFVCGPVTPGRFNWLFQTIMSAINALNIGDMVSKLRSINTTEGLTGGGNLEEDRTLRLNIPGLEEKTSVANNDLYLVYDPVAGAHRKTTRLNFIAGLGGEGGILSNGGNIGDGQGQIFSGIDTDTLEFRTIKDAGGIAVSTAGDVVTLALADMGAELTYA